MQAAELARAEYDFSLSPLYAEIMTSSYSALH